MSVLDLKLDDGVCLIDLVDGLFDLHDFSRDLLHFSCEVLSMHSRVLDHLFLVLI